MLNNFSFEQLTKVEKFQFVQTVQSRQFYTGLIKNHKYQARRLQKILKILQEFDNLENLISSYYPKSIWII